MRIKLKLAIIKAGLRNYEVARLANQNLPTHEQLTELNVSHLITDRRVPTMAQAASIAKVLEVEARDIFSATKTEKR